MTHNEPAEPEYPQTRFRLPPGATQILLVRHGASAAARPSAPFPLLDGQGDPDLAPAGREQADRVCARLATLTLDAVYVTTLRRTTQTATPLLDRLDFRDRRHRAAVDSAPVQRHLPPRLTGRIT